MPDIIWSDEALQDLDLIHAFLAEKSFPAAQKIIFNIIERVKQLASFPESGQVQEISTGFQYRYIVEGHYKIIYRTNESGIVINALFDTRRDPEKLLKGLKKI
jgi:toxin ParE1/3/4